MVASALFRALLFPALLLLPVAAQSAAWERPAGEVFLSLSYGVEVGDDAEEGVFSFYAEYGLGHRLTLGAKVDQRPRGPHTAEIFLRRNIGPADAQWQTAFEIGIAADFDVVTDPVTGALEPMIEQGGPKLAFHLGRGFDSPFGPGWVDLRFARVFPGQAEEARTELDLLAGINLGARSFATVELWNDFTSDGQESSLAPGFGYRIGDRVALTVRYVANTSEGTADRIELGTWLEF